MATELCASRPRTAADRRPFGRTNGLETPWRRRVAGVSAASKGLWTLSLAAVAVCLVGCTSHFIMPLQLASEIEAKVAYPEGADPLFEYSHTEVPFDNHILGRGATPDYSLRQLEIPSAGDNGQKDRMVRAEYYRSESPAPRPLVIVLPIFARYTYPSQKLSTFLQKQSRGLVHVLNVAGESFLFDWAGLTETSDPKVFMELVREGTERERIVVIDIRRLVDWAEQQPEIDGSRVALVGFSRSAIVAGVAATQEARLAATVLVMGGARPHEIVARCSGKRTSAVQRNAVRQLGWDQDELEARIRPMFSGVDAANYPGRVDPEKVLMFEASRDECIQESARMALWESMGRPERISLNYGHRIAFAAMTPLGGNWICHRTWEFLQRRLLSTDQSS
jgi:dienelactone hydrolase